MDGLVATLQKVVSALDRLDRLAEDVGELRQNVTQRMERMEMLCSDLRERVARLETSRQADSAQIQADIARFKAEIERAELRLSRQLPTPDQ
jgi:hypothetical protein